MASIAKRSDGRWRARYRDAANREHARHFDRKVDAERWLAATKTDLDRGLYIDPAGAKRTFGDFAQAWMAAQVHRPTTRAQVETHYRRHIEPFFGDRQLGAVRTSEVQAWVKGRSDVLAPATVRVVYSYLAAIFSAAVADRLIPATPCTPRRVSLPKIERRQIEPLPVAGVQALAAAAPARYRAMVIFAASTGLRQGEVFGLQRRHVDFLRRSVRVEQQLVTMPHLAPYVAPPKTAASVRTVPLPQVALDALAAHLAEFPVEDPDGFIFTTAAGEPVRRTSFSALVWRPAVKAAQLPDGTHFHDLRHFYASLLIHAGESVKAVQSRLGHASAAETLETYAHLWPDSEDRTRQAVDGALSAALRTDCGLDGVAEA